MLINIALQYRSWSFQDSQKLQNNASSHYTTTILELCIYFLQYETPLFRIHVFRTSSLPDAVLLLPLISFYRKMAGFESLESFYKWNSCCNYMHNVSRVCGSRFVGGGMGHGGYFLVWRVSTNGTVVVLTSYLHNLNRVCEP